MKVELEFNVNTEGKPVIYIEHIENDDSIEQRMLSLFIEKARSEGLSFECVGKEYKSKINQNADIYEIS